MHPVAVWRWFTSESTDLPGDDEEEEENQLSPLQWLRTGRSPDRVADLAAGIVG